MSTERYRTLSDHETGLAASQCLAPPPALLNTGIRQFNAGEYFECHETLEDLWNEEHGPVRRMYQGILHIAVGLYHARRGNRHGTLTKLRSGLNYLAPFGEICQSVDLRQLRTDIQRILARLEADEGAPLDPALHSAPPRIRQINAP